MTGQALRVSGCFCSLLENGVWVSGSLVLLTEPDLFACG